jgi:hypothetical protein
MPESSETALTADGLEVRRPDEEDWYLVIESRDIVSASGFMNLTKSPSLSHAMAAGQKRYIARKPDAWGIAHPFGASNYEEFYPIDLNPRRSPAALRRSNTEVRIKFERYRLAWQDKAAAMSVLNDIAVLDEYQHIIGLGLPVVPFIIEELRHELDHWFWALKAIVGEDHAAEASTMKEAAEMWIAWYDSLSVSE